LQKQIEDLKDEVSRLRLGGWRLLGILHHEAGQTSCHDMFGDKVPEPLRKAPPNCDHCQLLRKRRDTFVLRDAAEEVKQVGRTCLEKFLPGEDFTQYKRLSDRLLELTREIKTSRAFPAEETSSPLNAGPQQVAGDTRSDWDESQYIEEEAGHQHRPAEEAFPGPTISTADLLKFLIDRTGYIKLLEAEDTPEAYSRVENLHELVNAAMDSRDRAESLDQFLDHAALIADADDYDARSQITLMSLHAAKGLEFPLVFLTGLEEGLFPHSRTMLVPDDIEEERRLCYVGMTRAMDQLILSRAVYRRRYGTDLPEASVPSRFLEEVPIQLVEELGTRRSSTARVGTAALGRPAGRSPATDDAVSTHYSYEDEDQSAAWNRDSASARDSHFSQNRREVGHPTNAPKPSRAYNSIENIAEFFASRGKKFTIAKQPVEEPTGKRGFRPGQRVRHPKYGEGTVYQREGEGEEAKITVQFPRFGLKKLVEKYAQLERA
jgi:DNA helicase-2/ATP-dependent DNA helicase PcrA